MNPLIGLPATFETYEGDERDGVVMAVDGCFALVGFGDGTHGRVFAEAVCERNGLSVSDYNNGVGWAKR